MNIAKYLGLGVLQFLGVHHKVKIYTYNSNIVVRYQGYRNMVITKKGKVKYNVKSIDYKKLHHVRTFNVQGLIREKVWENKDGSFVIRINDVTTRIAPNYHVCEPIRTRDDHCSHHGYRYIWLWTGEKYWDFSNNDSKDDLNVKIY